MKAILIAWRLVLVGKTLILRNHSPSAISLFTDWFAHVVGATHRRRPKVAEDTITQLRFALSACSPQSTWVDRAVAKCHKQTVVSLELAKLISAPNEESSRSR
jgi:hypothetical protein